MASSVGGITPGTGEMQYTLTNHGDQPLLVLRWETGLGSRLEDLFTVRLDGEVVRYRGPDVVRIAPDEGAYVRLEPGESLSAVVDLTTAYDLRMPGVYDVEVNGRFSSLLQPGTDADDFASYVAATPAIHTRGAAVEVDAEHTVSPAAPPSHPPSSLSTQYTSCDADATAAVQSAVGDAMVLAFSAGHELTQRPRGTLYTYWFGAYERSRWATVTNNYARIYDELRTDITYDCSCPYYDPVEDWYIAAWVNRDYPGWVAICNAFWLLPDYRAQTLVHEMSHFSHIANTDDIVYDEDQSADLAASDPDSAIRNADNYGWFVRSL